MSLILINFEIPRLNAAHFPVPWLTNLPQRHFKKLFQIKYLLLQLTDIFLRITIRVETKEKKLSPLLPPRLGVRRQSNQSLWRHLSKDKDQLNRNYFISLGTFTTNINYMPTLIIPTARDENPFYIVKAVVLGIRTGKQKDFSRECDK